MGIDALGPGDGDLAFGLDFLRSEAKNRRLPYVSANLQGADGALIFPESLLLERGKHRIGVTSVLSMDKPPEGVRVAEVVPALRVAVDRLRNEHQADVVVVLSHVGKPLEQRLAVDVQGIDLMVLGHGRSVQMAAEMVGSTPMLQAGSRGKMLGQATLRFVPGGKGFLDPTAKDEVLRQRAQIEAQVARYQGQIDASADPKTKERLEKTLQFTKKRLESLQVPEAPAGTFHPLSHKLVEMNAAIPDETAVDKLVDAMLEKLGPEAKSSHDGHGHGPGDGHDHGGGHKGELEGERMRDYGDFAGATACRSCHATQYADWQKQGHARAYPSLVREKRHMDLDCWRCHVTGAGQPGGPKSPEDVGMLRNVQCEACHGPSKPHTLDPKKNKPVRSPAEATCRTCHDSKQDGGRFEHKLYRDRVDHQGEPPPKP